MKKTNTLLLVALVLILGTLQEANAKMANRRLLSDPTLGGDQEGNTDQNKTSDTSEDDTNHSYGKYGHGGSGGSSTPDYSRNRVCVNENPCVTRGQMCC